MKYKTEGIMQRIAKFHKASFERFQANWAGTFPDTPAERVRGIYEDIRLPRCITSGSTGHNFFTPVAVNLKPGETLKIPAGVRTQMKEGWVLQIFPWSSLDFEFRLRLSNTVGIIDSDCFYSDDQGHMFVKMTNDTSEGRTVELSVGTGFAQEIFLPSGVIVDDDCKDSHNGGFGNTDARQVSMVNRGRRGNYSGCRPQGNGYYQRAEKPGSNAKKRKRRRIRVMKAVIAWTVYVLLIDLIAVGTFRAVSSAASFKKQQMHQKGAQKMASGDYAGVIGDFDAALGKSGKRSKGLNGDVLVYRAGAGYRLRDYEASIRTYDLLLEMEPSTASYLYAQSMYYSQIGDAEDAVVKYQAGTALEKDAKASAGKMEALVAADGACVDAKEYERAMGFYQDALKEGMKHGRIYNQMGLCQMAGGDYQGTLDSFEQGYEALATGYELGTGTSAIQTAVALPEDASLDMTLLEEPTYNRVVAYRYLNQYQKTLELFKGYVIAFSSGEDTEREIAFLKTR